MVVPPEGKSKFTSCNQQKQELNFSQVFNQTLRVQVALRTAHQTCYGNSWKLLFSSHLKRFSGIHPRKIVTGLMKTTPRSRTCLQRRDQLTRPILTSHRCHKKKAAFRSACSSKMCASRQGYPNLIPSILETFSWVLYKSENEKLGSQFFNWP